MIEKINIKLVFFTFPLIFFIFIFLFVILTYPALSGSFELDDLGNLSGLDRINSSSSFLYYIFNGLSSTLGRPLSLFSFALQADSWPNPYFFKLINLCIHLTNGILVFVLFNLLTKSKTFVFQKRIFSLSLSGLWLLAPIHIYSTFYVIQRMTLLSSLFILLALCVHVYVRKNRFKFNINKSYLLISCSLGLFLVLGILSKESAVLLCVYILVIEFTVLKDVPTPRYWSLWRLFFLFLPLVMLVVYLAWTGRLVYGTIEIYDVNWYQRLLNESIILWKYIQLIIFPEYGAFGLIHDDYKTIHSFSDNYWSLLSILGIFTLIFLSFIFRKKYVIPAFGILWFFGGHLLESTVVPLELYFEHRNYLPSLGVLVCLVYIVQNMINSVDSGLVKKLIFISIVCYCSLYGYVLRNTAMSWSSSGALTAYQLKFHPSSLRAQMTAVSYYFQTGRLNDALILMNYIGKTRPELIGHRLNMQMLKCYDERFVTPEKDAYFSILRNGKFDFAIDNAITQIYNLKTKGQCPSISYAELREIIKALQENIHVSRILWENLAIYKSKTYTEESNWSQALMSLDETDKNSEKRIDFYFLKLKYQYMLGDMTSANQTISYIDERFRKNPKEKYIHSASLDVFKSHMDQIEPEENIE